MNVPRKFTTWLNALEKQVQAVAPAAPPKLERQALWAYEAALEVLGPERTALVPPQCWSRAYWGLSALRDGAPMSEVHRDLYPQAPWQAPEPQCLRIIEEWLTSPEGQMRYQNPLWHWEVQIQRRSEVQPFTETVLLAARVCWPELNTSWDTLTEHQRDCVWKAWITAAAEHHQQAWETLAAQYEPDEFLRRVDKTIVVLHEQFTAQILRREWQYATDGAIFSHQPGTLSGRPDNSREAWIALCKRQLADRWAREVADRAAAIDVAFWIEHADEENNTDPNGC